MSNQATISEQDAPFIRSVNYGYGRKPLQLDMRVEFQRHYLFSQLDAWLQAYFYRNIANATGLQPEMLPKLENDDLWQRFKALYRNKPLPEPQSITMGERLAIALGCLLDTLSLPEGQTAGEIWTSAAYKLNPATIQTLPDNWPEQARELANSIVHAYHATEWPNEKCVFCQ